jgi:hypothetical protein
MIVLRIWLDLLKFFIWWWIIRIMKIIILSWSKSSVYSSKRFMLIDNLCEFFVWSSKMKSFPSSRTVEYFIGGGGERSTYSGIFFSFVLILWSLEVLLGLLWIILEFFKFECAVYLRLSYVFNPPKSFASALNCWFSFESSRFICFVFWIRRFSEILIHFWYFFANSAFKKFENFPLRLEMKVCPSEYGFCELTKWEKFKRCWSWESN